MYYNIQFVGGKWAVINDMTEEVIRDGFTDDTSAEIYIDVLNNEVFTVQAEGSFEAMAKACTAVSENHDLLAFAPDAEHHEYFISFLHGIKADYSYRCIDRVHYVKLWA